jgi:hypothetical protein
MVLCSIKLNCRLCTVNVDTLMLCGRWISKVVHRKWAMKCSKVQHDSSDDISSHEFEIGCQGIRFLRTTGIEPSIHSFSQPPTESGGERTKYNNRTPSCQQQCEILRPKRRGCLSTAGHIDERRQEREELNKYKSTKSTFKLSPLLEIKEHLQLE